MPSNRRDVHFTLKKQGNDDVRWDPPRSKFVGRDHDVYFLNDSDVPVDLELPAGLNPIPPAVAPLPPHTMTVVSVSVPEAELPTGSEKDYPCNTRPKRYRCPTCGQPVPNEIAPLSTMSTDGGELLAERIDGDPVIIIQT